ncbi:MAG: aminotransferase class IV [Bacteroidales bacterium]|nr:aminotransferase class IV [Bacteroidales bacterium]
MNSIRFIESLKVVGGEFMNIELHQQRIDISSKIFSINKKIVLKDINIPKSNNDLVQKCRILYSNDDLIISFSEYKQRKIESLKLVFDDSIDYSFKFEDRQQLNQLYDKREDCSDIIIVKNGHLTDTSFSNIILFDGENYFTPNSFLLNGTMRQKLLSDKRIIEKEIKYDELSNYNRIILINALNSIEDNLSIKIENIF